MSRLIDADALMKAMYHRAFETDGDTVWQSGCWVRYRAIEQTVKAQPTIEERKTGRWAWSEADASWCCAACGCVFEEIEWKPVYNYCPNCGANMRGEGHEN